MPDSTDVQRLLMAAAKAPTLPETQRLVAAAEELRTDLYAQAAAERDVELANAVVRDHLQPTAVYEHHTAATDWIGDLDTTSDPRTASYQAQAQGTVWFNKLAAPVKADADEFTQQALGMAQRIAGAYGQAAPQVRQAFLDHVHGLRQQASLHQAINPAVFPSNLNATYDGMPPEYVSSERANVIQQLENNDGPNASQDVTPVNDPGLGQVDTQVERINNTDLGGQNQPTTNTADLGQDKQASLQRTAAEDKKCEFCGRLMAPLKKDDRGKQYYSHTNPDFNEHTIIYGGKHLPTVTPSMKILGHTHKENGMHAQCPTCGGHGRVAVRQAPLPSIEQIISLGVSGLDQIDQTVEPHDSEYRPTPYPADVAFPWTMQEGAQQQVINQAEQQIAEREQRKGASRMTKQQVATYAAQEAYRQVMAGYDDSGWAGDMGATPPGPGQQDGGPTAPYSNLGYPDPVYGQGGDNPNQPLKPYGADECVDYTNNPGMNYTPGQPTQYDTPIQTSNAPAGGGAPGFPNPPINNGQQKKKSSVDNDPELQKALAFVRQRRALLEAQDEGGTGSGDGNNGNKPAARRAS